MQIRPLSHLCFLAAAILAAACSSKSTPNEDNFAAAVNQKLASNPVRCLPPTDWPATAEPGDHGNPYAFYDAGVGFVQAGIATMKEEGPDYSTNFRKKAIFALTDEGKKQLVLDKRQPFPGKDYGRFCYGKVKFTKVLKWDEPTKIGSVKPSQPSLTPTRWSTCRSGRTISNFKRRSRYLAPT